MCVRAAALAAVLLPWAAWGLDSWVRNGGFEAGTSAWSLPLERAVVVARDGSGHCLRLQGEGTVSQDVYVRSRSGRFTVALDLCVARVAPRSPGEPGYAFAAVYQHGETGDLLGFRDFVQARVPAVWTRVFTTVELLPGVVSVSVRAGLYRADGEILVDNWTVVSGVQPAGMGEVVEPRSRSGVPGGVVGIFSEPGFPAVGAASEPAVLARILAPAAGRIEMLTADDMADPEVLSPGRVDVLVLPYGESFPAAARESLIAYLHGGGNLVSAGGYAFNHLLVRENGVWVPEDAVVKRRLAAALVPPEGLIEDVGFEFPQTASIAVGAAPPPGRWGRDSAACTVVSTKPYSGGACARVHAPEGYSGGERKWDLRVPARSGRTVRVSAVVRTEDIAGEGFAYAAMYQYDAHGTLVAFRDFAQVRGTTPWTVYTDDLVVADGVVSLYIKCGLYRCGGNAWFDDVKVGDITGIEPRPLNTATGVPRDGLEVTRTQIGVFDADYRLKRVAGVRRAEAQHIFPEPAAAGRVEGWAASAVRGEDSNRWIPLLTAHDRYGRLRGAVAALVLNYNGFYSGSHWFMSGVENVDLFADAESAMADGLRRAVQFMVRGSFLRNLSTDLSGYEAGEPVRISVAVEPGSAAAAGLSVEFSVFSAVERRRLWQQTVEIKAGEAASACAEDVVSLPDWSPGLYRVRARLAAGGTVIDEMDTGFAILGPPGGSDQWTPLRFADNYFRLGRRPLFLFGTDTYANVYTSSSENPLTWAAEHRACRDFGFQIYENLQYSNPGYRMGVADWRRFRAMSQSTTAAGLVFMPCLLVGHNAMASADALQAQAQQCRDYARELGDTPRLLWYVNGDYRLRHTDLVDAGARWRAYLRRRYGSAAAVCRAWGRDPAGFSLETAPFPPEVSSRWDDVPSIDRLRFQAGILRAWNATHVAAIREHDPDHPITAEYYSIPFDGMDLRLTLDGLDVANIGFFGPPGEDIDMLPLKLRWNDVRARGRSSSLGEYGVKTHPAWSIENGATGYHIRRSETEQKQLFMAVAHYAFGLGASKVQNWCLRDANQRVFPWGVFYPGPLVPKDVACTHRNLSLLFRLFAPRYDAPALTVLLCDNMRLGRFPELGVRSGHACFRALLELHVDFSVLSDSFADDIPETTRVLVYPSALCPDDGSIEALCRWVEAGGNLLLTGDFGYDSNRQHTRADRLERLAGVRWQQTLYSADQRGEQRGVRCVPAADDGPPALSLAPMAVVRVASGEVLLRTPDGFPVVCRQRVGEGTVVWVADPLELATDAASALVSLYDWFVTHCGVRGFAVEVDGGALHAMRVPTRLGQAAVLFSRRQGTGQRPVRFVTPAGRITVGVRDGWPAVAAASDAGDLLVLGGAGSGQVDGEEIFSADGLVTLAALDEGDLRQSTALLVLPFTGGRITLPGNRRKWDDPVVVLGDIHGGRLRVLESAPVNDSRVVAVDMDADRATLIGLVCDRPELARWSAVLDEWIRRPDLRPGF